MTWPTFFAFLYKLVPKSQYLAFSKQPGDRHQWRVFFFYQAGTAVWPREFCHGNLLLKQSGKIPVAIPRFLLCKKKTPSLDSPWFGLSYGAFAIVYPSLVTLLWLIHSDSRVPRELTRRRPWNFVAYRAMRHRRETTLPLNLGTVCILMLSINCFISRDSVAYDIWILNFAAYRDASREGERKGEKREKKALTTWPRIWVAAGSK